MKGDTFVRKTSRCLTCGLRNSGSREDHAQRAWAKSHAIRNPGHEARFLIERETIYAVAPQPSPSL